MTIFTFSPRYGKRRKKDDDSKLENFRIGDSAKFSVDKLLKLTLGTSNHRPVDALIDDQAMPEAANYVEFVNDPRFLNTKAWARQNEIGTKTFAEYCPRCTDMEWFCKEPEGKLSAPKAAKLSRFLEKVQLLSFDECPKCGATKTELVRSKELPFYNELVGVAGQRASKSSVVAMQSAYIVHKYLKLQKPVELLGLLSTTLLHGTFCALTYSQARETLWDPFYTAVVTSPWFKEYHKMMDDYSSDYGDDLYKAKDTFLLYRHRGLFIYPSGPNKRTLRGRTRFLAAIDELGWFDNEANNQKERLDANEVYVSLERSLLTVRNASRHLLRKQHIPVIPGMFMNVSSPSSRRDKIMTLYRDAESVPTMFSFKHATWEINPKISREDLQAEYTKDPLAAARDYGAEPPLSANPFFDSVEVIEKALKIKNACRISQKVSKRADGTRYTYGELTKIDNDGRASILAIDAGYSNNSFAFAVVRAHPSNPRMIQVPLLGEIIPKQGYPVNYNRIYENILKPVIKARNVRYMVADRWQSIKVLHDAQEDFKSIEGTEQYSLKYEDMILVKESLIDGRIMLPKLDVKQITDAIEYDPANYPTLFVNCPVAHLVLQMVSVRDTGDDVVKGDVTDDLWRAVALGGAFALDPEYAPLLATQVAVGGGGLGRIIGRSAGGGSSLVTASSIGLSKGRSGR